MDHIPYGVVLSTFHSVPEQTLRFRYLLMPKISASTIPPTPHKMVGSVGLEPTNLFKPT